MNLKLKSYPIKFSQLQVDATRKNKKPKDFQKTNIFVKFLEINNSLTE